MFICNSKEVEAISKDRDYWKEKYDKLEQLIKYQEGCKYCIDVASRNYSRCSRCNNKEHWFFDETLLKEMYIFN